MSALNGACAATAKHEHAREALHGRLHELQNCMGDFPPEHHRTVTEMVILLLLMKLTPADRTQVVAEVASREFP